MFAGSVGSLVRVLSSPARHSSSSRSWRAIAIVVAVVVVAGGAAFFLLHKNASSSPPGSFDPSDPASPIRNPEANPVHFQLRSSDSVRVVTKTPDAANVQQAFQDIRNTLGNMYTVAFTDPANWKSGNYDNVFGFFAQGKISDAAKADEATLTLGQNAGDTYEDVTPRYASLVIKMLTDKGGQPYTASATADFTADARTKDGASQAIKSHATYIMQRGEGGWIVVGYKAKRTDGKAGAGGVGTHSPKPGHTPSPRGTSS